MLVNNNKEASLVSLDWQRTHREDYLEPLVSGYDDDIEESDFYDDKWWEEWEDESSYSS